MPYQQKLWEFVLANLPPIALRSLGRAARKHYMERLDREIDGAKKPSDVARNLNRIVNDYYAMAEGNQELGRFRQTVYKGLTDDDLEALGEAFSTTVFHLQKLNREYEIAIGADEMTLGNRIRALRSASLKLAAELPPGDPLRRKLLAALKREAAEDPADKAMLMVQNGERFVRQYITEWAEELEKQFKEAAKHAETLERKFSGTGWRSASAALQGDILKTTQRLERSVTGIREEIESTVDKLPRV
jgi:hypothetical protein